MNTRVQYQSMVMAERTFLADVYGWMTAGLALTGLVSFELAHSPAFLMPLLANKPVFFGLMLLQLVLVVVLSARADRLSPAGATFTFLAYSALTGVTMSTLFLTFTSASIASTFFVTAATFGLMSLYGYRSKADLTSVGNICFMGLVGIILASIVNFFLRSAAVYWITTYLGIFIFVGLTAYDTQKLKDLVVDGSTESQEAVVGALVLYLDFINLFLQLLNFTGKRRE